MTHVEICAKRVPEAVKTLCETLRVDPELAWAWHCNITMMAQDAGSPRAVADEGSARFLQLLAGVDIRKHPHFPTTAKPTPGFGAALEALETGKRVARAGWNGKGMWLQLMESGAGHLKGGGQYHTLPFIVMKTADEKFVPWLASQTDVLAKDWQVLA